MVLLNRFHPSLVSLSIVALLALTTSIQSFARSPEPFVVGWKEWSPHVYPGVADDPEGVNIELIKEMARRAGFRLTFKEVPWARGLRELQEGSMDIAMSALKNSEREEYARFSRTYFKLEYNVMFVRKADLQKWRRIRSLTDTIGTQFFIGVTRGSIFSDEHSALVDNPRFQAQLQEVNTVEQNMEKLMRGRITGFIADEIAGTAMLKKAGYSKDTGILFYLYGSEEAASYLMYSRKSVSQADADKFDDALESMKTDGTYDAILKRYLPEQLSN